MYLIIDAAIVGQFIGVNAGCRRCVFFNNVSDNGFCNGSCAGFAIPGGTGVRGQRLLKDACLREQCPAHSGCDSVVITVITCIFCERILKIVNTPADIFHDAWLFLMLNFLAIPFTIAYNILSGFIRALGDSKQPFYFLIASSVVNILLDFLLIIAFGMGVEGAGIATMLSQIFASALCALYIKKRMRILIPQGHERAYNDKMVGKLLNNGIPMGLQFSITAIGTIMLQSANNALGTVYVASFTAAIAREVSVHVRV